MNVDAHHHLWDPAHRQYPWMAGPAFEPIRRRYDLTDLRAETDAAGISATVLVQTVSDAAETEQFLAEAIASGGLIAGVIGWVDLTVPSVGDELARLADGPGGSRLVGVRHQVENEPDPRWLGRARRRRRVGRGRPRWTRVRPPRPRRRHCRLRRRCRRPPNRSIRPRPRRQAPDRRRHARPMARRRHPDRPPSQRRRQVVRTRHRGRTGRPGPPTTSPPSSTTWSTRSGPTARCSAVIGPCASWRPATAPCWRSPKNSRQDSAGANATHCSRRRPGSSTDCHRPERSRVAHRRRARGGTARGRRRAGGRPPWPSPADGG